MTITTIPATTALTCFSLELEITRRCQLTCPSLCYAQAGPTGDHGTMTTADWQALITEAKAAGVTLVQLIGGEPTIHPDFQDLIRHAIAEGLTVEVFSNLYNIRAPWWDLLGHPQVRLGTSYYSDVAAEHDRITARPGSHARTRANIIEALQRGIPLRAGIIEVFEEQRVEQARVELEALGVTNIRIDKARPVGRAAPTGVIPNAAKLCGRCGDHKAAISANGDVTPCVLGRFLVADNIKNEGLVDILVGPRWDEIMAIIPKRPSACSPDGDTSDCGPADVEHRTVSACNPDSNGNDCAPAETEACGPAYDDD